MLQGLIPDLGEKSCPETHLIPLALDASNKIIDLSYLVMIMILDGTCIRDYIHVVDIAKPM